MCDPIMVDGIKCLGSVEEEQETIQFLNNSRKKKGINVDDMVASTFTREKTFLGRVDKVIDSRHDAACYARRKKPVVGVCDTKGAGVREKTSEFFGEEKKKTMVSTVWGAVAFESGAEGSQ